jgi:hypothetical protein
MRRGGWTFGAALVAVATVLGASGPAAASDGIGVLVGYGYVKQERMGFASEGHLLSIGIHSPGDALEDGIFAAATFDFVVDHTYDDLTQLAFTFEGAYAWGSSFLGGYLGFAMRTGIDGYPKASWSPLDPGGVLGFIVLMGPVGIGGEFRGWLGWNVYQDLSNEIEPYFDARMYMSIVL